MRPLLPTAQLTRHAVCLGMTGSGKTGLCISILEDVALAGVPILAVDPKGDLANLALVLDPTPEAYAAWVPDPAATAAAWAAGLAEAGLDDLPAFRDAVDVHVLTPGSSSGAPVDLLAALSACPPGLDAEGRREAALGAVAALLALVGLEADPRTDPAAILLCRLMEDAFQRGEPLPLERLIPAVVDPPVTQVGYFHVDAFLPREARLALARRLNAVLASPGFAAWRGGAPLDLDAWLTPPDPAVPGSKTPVTVLYLAHLDEPGRRFFLTLLLHHLVGWSRRQPGTPALRALLYLDESAGFLPPHPADPPTKWPLLTLLKQARAVGLGVMLATQNPVDLDYKAMSNAGTWLVGRLRTRQDRRRVLDGLSQAGVDVHREPTLDADSQATTDVDDQLASLPPRTFLLLDDHGVRPVRSRHTRALLRGPLTRAEVGRLVRARPGAAPADDGLLPHPPPLPDGLSPRWLHADGAVALGHAPGEAPVWSPAVYARLRVRFDNERGVVDERTVHRLLRASAAAPSLADLPPPEPVALSDDHLHRRPLPGGRYRPLPGWLADPALRTALQRAWLRDAARDEEGPPEAWQAEADDVSLQGLVVVWIPT